MKTLLSIMGGAITITEANGVISLNFNESAGGGKLAGFLKASGSVQMNAEQELEVGEGVVIGKLPAAWQPEAQIVAGIINAAVKAAE